MKATEAVTSVSPPVGTRALRGTNPVLHSARDFRGKRGPAGAEVVELVPLIGLEDVLGIGRAGDEKRSRNE